MTPDRPQKIKLLRLLDLLQRETDVDHPISRQDLCQRLNDMGNLNLDYDEIVITKDVSVAHGGVMAIYTDELILTNKKIICLHKGMFGGTKTIFHFRWIK